MKAWMVPLLLAAVALAPSAEAHQCSGSNCGPCPEGATEYHQHADSSGKVCQSGAGFSQEAGPGYAKQSPGSGTFWTLTALLGTAGTLALTRRA